MDLPPKGGDGRDWGDVWANGKKKSPKGKGGGKSRQTRRRKRISGSTRPSVRDHWHELKQVTLTKSKIGHGLGSHSKKRKGENGSIHTGTKKENHLYASERRQYREETPL